MSRANQKIQRSADGRVRGDRLPRRGVSHQGESVISISAVTAKGQFSW
jgi:hypothetical protein